ncbi:MAG: hypothetical protein LBK53_05445 [Heliobacteriaceae bacterium]|jgi:hypothetical protein|nr:hypothetical protein [Heliobacteriaceae bacterium]
MYLFIAAIFTAELIIAGALISFIVKADRKICTLNNQVTAFIPAFEDGLRKFYNIVHNLKGTLCSLFCLLQKKKNMYRFKLIKILVWYVILIFCKGKYKRAAVFFHLLVTAREFLDKFIKC